MRGEQWAAATEATTDRASAGRAPTTVGTPLDDAGLVPGDVGDGRTERDNVVEANRSNDAHNRLDNVGGVDRPPAPTSTTAISTCRSANHVSESADQASA